MKFSAKPFLTARALSVSNDMLALMRAETDETHKAILVAAKNDELNKSQEIFLEAWWGLCSQDRAKWKDYVFAGKQIRFWGGLC